MKELTLLDVLVFFGIVAWSLVVETSLLGLITFALDILLHLPHLLWQVVCASLSVTQAESHYSHIADPLQVLIITLLRYAFDRVDFRIGRLFLNARNCLRFARWRHGRLLPFSTFQLAASKQHAAVEVYQFASHIEAGNVKKAILYIHGGGLIVGSVPFYSEFLTELANSSSDTVVIAPEYDLVPEACFPTQINQIMAVYKHIRLTWPEAALILGGDSAGAGLCQSLLCTLSMDDMQWIDRVFYISPWLDFTSQNDRKAGHGDYITPNTARRYGQWYAPKQQDEKDTGEMATTHASPMSYTDEGLQRTCPDGGMLIMVGGAECLLSDSLSLVTRLANPTRVKLHIEPHEIHAYVLTNLYLRRGPAKVAGLNRILDFIE